MGESTSLLTKLVTWAIVGILAVVAIKIALSVLGFVMGLAGFLLFVVAPVLLLGWLALKAWHAFTSPAV